MTAFVGTSADETLTGTLDDDTFNMTQGGADTVFASDGLDRIEMGGALTADDRLDGGGGDDFVSLSGDYRAGLVMAADTLHSVESMQFAPGRFKIAMNDANLDAGVTMTIYGPLQSARDYLRLDASAETDGQFIVTTGKGSDKFFGGASYDTFNAPFNGAGGSDKVKTGAGDDFINLYEGFDPSDRVNGGDGRDSLLLKCGYAGGLNIAGAMMKGIEFLQFAGNGAPSLDLTIGDKAVQAGASLTVYGATLGATTFHFDGSAETDGRYSISGDAGADTIIGGAGADSVDAGGADDVITGGGGADRLYGGDGADRFVYLDITDSAVGAEDYLIALAAGDIVDISAIDAKLANPGDQEFTLVEAFTGRAGQAVLAYDAPNDTTSLSLDQTGDGVADAVITMGGDQTAFGGFVL